MKNTKMEKILGGILLLAVLLLSTRGIRQAASVQVQKKETVVVLDAGHGGDDPGKIGINGALEKDINLEIVKKLKVILEKKGITVVLTREDEKGLYDAHVSNKKQDDMKKRCDKIDGANPDMTVSIHQNSYTQESVKGPQVFYFAQSEEGAKMAKYIQDAMNVQLAIERPRETKANDTYYLLKRTKNAVVLVECGFLSNEEEAEKLVTEDYQQQVASAIAEGIYGYLDGKAAANGE